MVNDVADTVEDMETRQRPPHVLAHEIDKEDSLLAGDLTDLLDESRDDMQNCIIVHQYAEPLMVGDAIHEFKFHLSRGDEDEDVDGHVGNATMNASNESGNVSSSSRSGKDMRNTSHSNQSALLSSREPSGMTARRAMTCRWQWKSLQIWWA
jgi:hypothetical protein